MTEWAAQREYGVRFDWGVAGARCLASDVAALVVVDVLSFSTSVTVAAEAGTVVHPYTWRDGTAQAFARQQGAELAVDRRATTAASPWSLSPAALRRAPFTRRLVLPSPNGSAIAAAAAVQAGAAMVVAGCLRNATAVARWLIGQGYGTPRRPVGVIAAGEHWPDGSLRPAVEDDLGAGAIIAVLRSAGAGPVSPEATAAAASVLPAADVAEALRSCVSGLELARDGFGDDVAIAGEVDATDVVPVLIDGGFRGRDTATGH